LAENPSGSGRRIVLAVIALVLAAVIGGVAGGLIVRATWSPGNGSSAAATAPGSNGTFAACPAAKVADQALCRRS
jgi:hypothetical protein